MPVRYVDSRGRARRGFLDLYDSTTHAFYEVKSIYVAPLSATDDQINNYAQSTIHSRKVPTAPPTSPSKGKQSVSGKTTWGIYDIYYGSSPEKPHLIAYTYDINEKRAEVAVGVMASVVVACLASVLAAPTAGLVWSLA